MRFQIVENDSGLDINSLRQLSSSAVPALLDKANNKIKHSLNLKRTPLNLIDGKIKASGIAGTIRLTNNIELDIIPKFIDTADNENWQESLFLLAALSKHGDIIGEARIHSSTDIQNSLYDIAGRILVDEYTKCKRKIIRQYRHEHFVDFAIDGEIDFDRCFEQNPDGIPQEKVIFDKINLYNATIEKAMNIVLPYVKDNSIRNYLRRAICELGTQEDVVCQRLHMPSRNYEWNNIYNLSFDIVSGFGGSLKYGSLMSPSFVVDTWRIWEWLMTIGIKIGKYNSYFAEAQKPVHWGFHTLPSNTQLTMHIDVCIYKIINPNVPSFILDAKYKLIGDDESTKTADLYEAFAYCKATNCNSLFLAYPDFSNDQSESGSVKLVDCYNIGTIKIRTVLITFKAISKDGEIINFSRRMFTELIALNT